MSSLSPRTMRQSLGGDWGVRAVLWDRQEGTIQASQGTYSRSLIVAKG